MNTDLLNKETLEVVTDKECGGHVERCALDAEDMEDCPEELIASSHTSTDFPSENPIEEGEIDIADAVDVEPESSQSPYPLFASVSLESNPRTMNKEDTAGDNQLNKPIVVIPPEELHTEQHTSSDQKELEMDNRTEPEDVVSLDEAGVKTASDAVNLDVDSAAPAQEEPAEKEASEESLMTGSEERIESDEEAEMPMIRVKQFGLFTEDADDDEDDQIDQMDITLNPDQIHSMVHIEMNEDTESSNTVGESSSSVTRPRRAAAAAAANVIREITSLEEEDTNAMRRRRSRDKDSFETGVGLSQVEVEGQERHRCHVCKKMTLSKVTVRQYGQDVFFCTPSCFNVFRNPDASRRSLPCAKCGIIQRDNSLTSTYYWETMNFCSDLCVGNYQIDIGSRCATCTKKVAWSSLGKYCVRFGSDVRQFCSAFCLETYKKNARVCFHCQLDIKKLNNVILANIPAKTTPKEFCSQDCVEMYIEQNLHQTVRHKPNQNTVCVVCSLLKPTHRELVLPVGNFKVCSDFCWTKLLEMKNIKRPVKCEICSKYLNLELGVLPPAFYVSASRKVYGFCSATCKNVYVLRSRQILACTTCKVKKYNYDLMEHIDENDVSAFAVCSLNCIPKPSQYIINLRETLTPATTASEMLNKSRIGQDRQSSLPGTTPSKIRTTIVSNDGSELNPDGDSQDIRISSVSSLAKGSASTVVLDDEESSRSCRIDAATGFYNDIGAQDGFDEWNSKMVDVTEDEINEMIVSVGSVVVFPPKEPTEQRNKGCLVRPFTKSVGTYVDMDISVDAGDVREKYIPILIPVPVYVPFPFYGLESPAPVPFPVPLPVPIPIPIAMPNNEQRDSNTARTIPVSSVNLNTPFSASAQLQPSQSALASTPGIETQSEIPVGMAIDSVGSFLDLAEPNVGESDSFDILNTIPNLEMELGLGGGHHPSTVSQIINPASVITGVGNISTSSNFLGGVVMPSSDMQWGPPSVLRGLTKIPDHTGLTREEFALREWQRHFGRDINFWCLSEKLLSEKLQELVEKGRHASGERYQPYFILYLCLGLQQYLRMQQRTDKIFYDVAYEPFIQTFVTYTEVSYSQGICEAVVDENHFWDSLELGVNSPEVLVFTLVYYNYKNFHLKTWQEHASLNFNQLVVNTKTGQNGQRYKSLTFVGHLSPSSGVEIHEIEPKTRCFLKLVEFYKYKCTNPSGPFYKSIIPQSPLKGKWYTTEPLSQLDIYRMLIRAMMIKG
ncbi:unnamed protein product [Allacma fusca]|uniref:TRASH domain-containing protein n=1 Tax=Allacma fusca TaxID=39272 RepID=A0A8J2LDI0_9HEXA|nr:unnamed protein product [Allacma fusca]